MKQKHLKTLHLISQAHIDPVWLWPWRDGCAEALTTMQSAVDRAAEFRDFKFTRSSAATYRWLQEMDPALFLCIRKLIDEGRWETVGGWVEQPDCNLPSTESFIRQSLYGKAWLAGALDAKTQIGYNVDSFGHAGGLPQLLKMAGLDFYVFMRPEPHENSSLPPLFWWKGDDGSRILTLRIPVYYSQSPTTTPDELEQKLREAEEKNFPGGFDHGVFFLGVGNHGGGPTRRHLERIAALQGNEALPELRFSTLRDYFQALGQSPKILGKLPVVRGELQHHARGCYSAAGKIKILNRQAEHMLIATEALLNIEGGSERGTVDHEPLHDAWWRLLFNQFHDILAGTCTPQTWAETIDRFGTVLTVAREVGGRAVHRLARRVNTLGENGSVLFVCNPLPWERKVLAQCDTFMRVDGAGALITHLEDDHGTKHPIQWAKADSSFGPWDMPWGKLSALVRVPAAGYQTFRLVADSKSKEKNKFILPLSMPGLTDQGLTSMKAGRVELLVEPIGLAVFRDDGDAWGHGIAAYGERIGHPKLINRQNVEAGPLFTRVRYHYTWQTSTIDVEYTQDSRRETWEVRLRFNWQEKRQILRLQIPSRLRNAVTFCQTAGGVTRRSAIAGEEHCQDWVAMEGSIGSRRYSICLTNSGSYSYEVIDGMLQIIIARSAPFAGHVPSPLSDDSTVFLDQGWQERRFWLFGYSGRALDRPLHRISREFQTPPEVMLDSAHPGTEPWRKSTLEISPSSVTLLAWKRQEKGDGMVLRLQETTGRRVTVRIHFPELKQTISVPLKAWKIITLRARIQKGAVSLELIDLLERSLVELK